MRSLARDGLHDLLQSRQVDRWELGGIDHVESHSISDAAVTIPQVFNELFSDAELNVGDKEGHGDGAGPSVGHLHHPVHPVHCGVAPDTDWLRGNMDLNAYLM